MTTTIYTHLEKISNAKKMYNQLLQDTSVIWKDVLFAFIADKVKDIPNFLRLEWSQYTPYFNDGDTCHFSINEPQIYLLNPDNDTSNDYMDLDGIEGDYDEFSDILNEIYNVMDDYLMLATFYDGYTIAYVRGSTKFVIEECVHD